MISARAKVLSWSEAVERFGPESPDQVVFTNGCFDILHAGHVQYLERARALGDALVVGLNTDRSVRELEKGAGRPFNEQADRALVLAGLAAVDAVVLFDQDTPYELIQEIRPAVLVKGGDYRPEEVVGKDLVEAHGGRVELIPFLPGRSTTGLVDRIRNAESVDP